jgi:DNA-binding response OmpR family regulator
MPKHRVLIVEDEPDIAGLIKHVLERSADADAEIVGTGEAALNAVIARFTEPRLRRGSVAGGRD